MLWVGLLMSLAGFVMLISVQLIVAGGNSRVFDIAEKIGMALFLGGLIVSILATGWIF